MAGSIEQLRIYKSARSAEDLVYELVKKLPLQQFYGLGNDLRRSSAAVSHHIMNTHRMFSYRLKLDELTAVRREAQSTKKYLETAARLSSTAHLSQEYTIIIKQSWGLTKWIATKQQKAREEAEIIAKEQLASSLA